MANNIHKDNVRELQRTLYLAAKENPQRRFHALYDKVYRRDILERAWRAVRANQGTSGIDRVSIEDIELRGVDQFLGELSEDLRCGTYRPQPGKRVWIPKPGRAEKRPLSIPAVRDRVVQAALKIVIEPVFEADFLPCSFGFRPKRSTHDALQVLIDEAFNGRRWVVETDIASCFDAIPHDGMLAAISERICDGNILRLLRMMLRCGIMEEGVRRNAITGTPQGGVISSLLANVYLHRLDSLWSEHGRGKLCRYADDLVVMCRSGREASRVLEELRSTLGGLDLELKDSKTRIVHLRERGPGFDFLGFHHRWVRARRVRHVTFLARWPSARAMQVVRDRICDLTSRSNLLLSDEEVIERVNRFLRSWAAYFRYGNSASFFNKIHRYSVARLCILVGSRHKGYAKLGWYLAVHKGKIYRRIANLNGIILALRPNRPWRASKSRR